MYIKKLKKIYFSPTGTTRKIVEAIAESIQCEEQEAIDFTKKKVRENTGIDINSELVIIGAPVYYGRIPAEVLGFLSKIRVNNVLAVLVVVYGNRAYEDSLKELFDVACTAGFIPIAYAAFIGEHSYSTEKLPMAHGRPDEEDLAKAKQFGIIIQKGCALLANQNDVNEIFVPGSRDYRNKEMPNYPLAPETSEERCDVCKKCIDVCPVEAISFDSPFCNR